MAPVPKNLNKKQKATWRKYLARGFSAPVAAKFAKQGRRFMP